MRRSASQPSSAAIVVVANCPANLHSWHYTAKVAATILGYGSNTTALIRFRRCPPPGVMTDKVRHDTVMFDNQEATYYLLGANDNGKMRLPARAQARFMAELSTNWDELVGHFARRVLNDLDYDARMTPAVESMLARGGSARTVASALGRECTDIQELLVFVNDLVTSGKFKPPTGKKAWPKRKSHPTGSREPDAAPRREEKRPRSRLPPVSGPPPPNPVSAAQLARAAPILPTPAPSFSGIEEMPRPEGVDEALEQLRLKRTVEAEGMKRALDHRDYLLHEFNTELYNGRIKPSAVELDDMFPSSTHYANRIIQLLQKPVYKPLVEWYSHEATLHLPLHQRSTEADLRLVRLFMEPTLHAESGHQQNYAARMWAVHDRVHHTSMRSRERFHRLHVSRSYDKMMGGFSRDHNEIMRILNLWTAIQHYPTLPFVVIGDNFQKGMTTKVTSFRDGDVIKLMTTTCFMRFDVPQAGALSRRRLDGELVVPMAREILPDVYYTPVLDGMKQSDMSQAGSLAGMPWPPPENYFARDRDLWMKIPGLMPRHSGSFGIGKECFFALGALDLNPDSDIDNTVWLHYIVKLFMAVHGDVLEFIIVMPGDHKFYDYTKKSVIADDTKLLDPIFAVPDHWHAIKNAVEKACYGFPPYFILFKMYVDVIRQRDRADRSTDFYSREMSLEVAMERLAIWRSVWMRSRRRFAIELNDRRAAEYDCQMLFVYFEFIVPVLLDFLVIIKTAPWSVYLVILPRFMQVLGTLSCSNYYNDFLMFACDLERLKAELPLAFFSCMENLNRFTSSVPIEKWHAVMTPLALHYRGIRDYKKIDGIAAEMPTFYEADEFARTYGDVLKTCKRHGWSLPDPSVDAKYFTEVSTLSNMFEALLVKMRREPASKTSDQIDSPIFGKYPVRLLGQDHAYQWPSS